MNIDGMKITGKMVITLADGILCSIRRSQNINVRITARI